MGSSVIPSFRYFALDLSIEYVAQVQINRADKLNAFTEEMWQEMKHVFEWLSDSPLVRAVVFSGAGPKAFSAGLDIQATSLGTDTVPGVSSYTKQDSARKAASLRKHILPFQRCITAIEACEKPVICVMHGFTLGLGIDIAVCADVRICASNTTFSIREVDIGIAADIGTLSRLPKVVGNASWVKDVCLSARNFKADEALMVGLVSAVYENKEKAIEEGIKWAKLIAEKSPVAVQSTKELLNYSRDHTVKEGLRYTAIWNSAALQSDDLAAIRSARTSKKKPTFEKL